MSDEQVITAGDSPRRIADFTFKNRLPSIGPPHYPQVGGLLGYGVAWTDVVRQSMVLVDKILKGAKPADLPVERTVRTEFVINLTAAKQTGVTIPPELLRQADKVIR